MYESLGERETLVREAPHLVQPLRMLVPVYDGDARPGWKVRAGLVLYDLFSFRKSLPRHRAMPERALAAYEPGLNRDGLTRRVHSCPTRRSSSRSASSSSPSATSPTPAASR